MYGLHISKAKDNTTLKTKTKQGHQSGKSKSLKYKWECFASILLYSKYPFGSTLQLREGVFHFLKNYIQD